LFHEPEARQIHRITLQQCSRLLRRATLIVIAILFAGSALAAQVLKSEPPMGAMKEGEVVLVDDGTCPKGQILRVIGGNHLKVGGNKQTVRGRSCVAR